MQHERFVAEIRNQCAALRSAAIAAGPDAQVPTCPGWTVHRLVAHLARVQSWARAALRDPTGKDVRAGRRPEDWDELLVWWDEQLSGMIDGLADPASPAWLPWRGVPRNAGSWARRQAHEAAIHRLDAEHARAGNDDPDTVAALVFDPEFAADGIEELAGWLLPSRATANTSTCSGSVFLHAADAGRSWTLRIEPGVAPTFSAGGLEGDLTIAGTADSVYRRLWGRPSHATVTGDTTLLEPLAAP
ncbi:maleylpyruvate isomerase family mycothiol-dependent enzyme [Amycolatopsis taiwanensis]|uniref:maleylpyruvate isomerase family mycothiol-dependent enzyme n=1 Tax=Amycolatopsis taiwanensis TaxID=342230 RepID=UPI0004850FDB|nr:maleylpyruvate isomerase family mycothiol-dependent enzyme [Amycolatopsis taiwanensis]